MASANDQKGSAKRPGHLVDVSQGAPLGPDERSAAANDWEARVRPSSRQVSVLVDPDEYERLQAATDREQLTRNETQAASDRSAASAGDFAETQDLDSFVAQLAEQSTARRSQHPDADVDEFEQLAARKPSREPAFSALEGTATADAYPSARGGRQSSPTRTGRRKNANRVLLGGLAALILAGGAAAIATSGHGSRHPVTPVSHAAKSDGTTPRLLGSVNHDIRQLSGATALADAQETARTESSRVSIETRRLVLAARSFVAVAPRHASSQGSSAADATTPSSDAVAPSQTTSPAPAETQSPAPLASPSSDSTPATSDGSSSSSTASSSGAGSSTKAFGYQGLLGAGHAGS